MNLQLKIQPSRHILITFSRNPAANFMNQNSINGFIIRRISSVLDLNITFHLTIKRIFIFPKSLQNQSMLNAIVINIVSASSLFDISINVCNFLLLYALKTTEIPCGTSFSVYILNL